MGKDKLRRFEAIKSFDNVFEPVREQDFEHSGKWNENIFKNEERPHSTMLLMDLHMSIP